MLSTIDRLLNGRTLPYAACAASLWLGLFFIFVWSPLPWGWHGIDFYYEIATALARGAPFPTIHIPWGYAYFLAGWYRVFGDRQWIPLCVQAVLNASIPLMLYHLVRRELGQRVAAMAAIVTGLFSFNTVYVSTQASDAVCTVLVVAMMWCIAIGRDRGRTGMFVAAGALAGLAFQFRPNLVLFPFFLGALYVVVPPRATSRLKQAAAFLAVFLAVAAPWVIRNYRWTGQFVPATTHGGVQLWFGTLQVGQYEDSWPYNPRAAFENPPIDYTSIDELPLVVTGRSRCRLGPPTRVEMVYWTNGNRTPIRAAIHPDSSGDFVLLLPKMPSPTALYYYFEAWWMQDGRPVRSITPVNGASAPRLFVVSRDHLSDLDPDGYMLDIFDIVRLVRHVAWMEPLAAADRFDFDRDDVVTEQDVRLAAALLVHTDRPLSRVEADGIQFERADASAVLTFADGSTLTVPRQSSGRITDIVPKGEMAAAIVSRSRPMAPLESDRIDTPSDPTLTDSCLSVDDATINRVPYRRLPHEMRRFSALAMDNIRHDPVAYLKASARRAVRVFVIEGSTDRKTAAQFTRSELVYVAGRALSIVYLSLFVVGLLIAIRQRQRLFVLMTPIVYVPATICFMLINARYSMTIQPFVFAIIAVALVAAVDRFKTPRPAV